jgi:ankyrin repeat protein
VKIHSSLLLELLAEARRPPGQQPEQQVIPPHEPLRLPESTIRDCQQTLLTLIQDLPSHRDVDRSYSLAIIEMILCGCNINPDFVDSSSGKRPIHIAAENGDAVLVKLLLRYGARVSVHDSKGGTPIHIATIKDDVAVVEALLTTEFPCVENSPVDRANALDKAGRPTLWYASYHGYGCNVFNLLIALGKDVINFRCRNNEESTSNEKYPTALWTAAAGGQVDIARALLRAGADPSISRSDGSTLLHRVTWPAIIGERTGGEAATAERAKSMLYYQETFKAVAEGKITYIADSKPFLKVLYRLMEYHAKHPGGGTRRRAGANSGLFWDLLRHGADPFARDSESIQPIHLVAAIGEMEMCAVLLDHHRSANRSREEEEEEEEQAAAASQRTAYVNVVYKNGTTPIIYAAAFGHTQVVRMLVTQYGADPKVREGDGNDAFAAACQFGHLTTAANLLGTYPKRDLSEPNKWGITVLDKAKAEGHQHVVDWLIDLGADAGGAVGYQYRVSMIERDRDAIGQGDQR